MIALLLFACAGGNDPVFDPGGGGGGFGECPAPSLERVARYSGDALLVGEEDVGWQARLSEPGPGLAVADLDGDGWLDAAVVSPRGRTALLRNDGAGGLSADPTAGIDGGGLPAALSVAAADIDGDGDIDLHLGGYAGAPDRILLNDGDARFDVVELGAAAAHVAGGSFGDADGDGDLDLVVADYVAVVDYPAIQAGTQAPTGLRFYDNDGGAFTLADPLPAAVQDTIPFLAQWLDADRDGALDLYVAADFGIYFPSNLLLRGDGAGAFARDADCDCEQRMFCMGVAVLDSDGDGSPDLGLTNIGRPRLLVNDGDGGFFEGGLAAGFDALDLAERGITWAIRAVDLDGDGQQELVSVAGPVQPAAPGEIEAVEDDQGETFPLAYDQPDLVLHARDGAFVDVSAEWGFATTDVGRAVIEADLDRDGRPDLVTTGWIPHSTDSYVDVFHAAGGCEGRLTVAFAGADAVGAQVEVEVGGEVRTAWLTPASTFSSAPWELYLGLGGADAADAVTVTFPGGRTESFADVAAGTRLSLD